MTTLIEKAFVSFGRSSDVKIEIQAKNVGSQRNLVDIYYYVAKLYIEDGMPDKPRPDIDTDRCADAKATIVENSAKQKRVLI